jgi:sarcosine oxidase
MHDRSSLPRFDTIVMGLGGAGSSAAYHITRAGGRVLGLEQFAPGHDQGSSHGKTRIYRTAYAEGAIYVPLVRRAQELWNELQSSTRRPIIRPTGGLYIGPSTSAMIAGARRSAAEFSLPHEVLTSEEVRHRFPQFRLSDSEIALWDPGAGAVFPENCMSSYCELARKHGAELRYNEPVTNWSASPDSVEVRTSSGQYRARSLVVTAGSWAPSVLSELRLPLRIERQLVCWFPPRDPALVAPGRMPVFIWDQGGDRDKYGLPDFGDGVKVGSWGGTVIPNPESADRTLHENESGQAREFVERYLMGVVPQEREWTSCLYTMSPDRHFLIGRHPQHANVAVISACSGHGFKFTSVLGEIASRLATGEETGFDLSAFDPGRFARAAPPLSHT